MLRPSLVAVLASLSVLATGLAASAADPNQKAGVVVPDQTSVVSDNPVNNTPQVLNGHVGALVQVGDTVYVGGVFANVQETGSGATISKTNLFAYSATTGKIDPNFDPVVKGGGIDDMVVSPDGTSLWISGYFAKVDGKVGTQKVARISLDTGAVVAPFKSPKPNGRVTDLNYANGFLYIGGLFSRANAADHRFIAVLDPDTGSVLDTVNTVTNSIDFAWGDRAAEGVWAMDVSPDGTKLVIAGNFMFAGGVEHPQIALYDLHADGAATLRDWNTTFFKPRCGADDSEIRDVAFSPDSSYFVTVTTGSFSGGALAGTSCDTVARFESNAAGPNQRPTWVEYTGGDTVTRVAVTSAAVYVGGHFRWMNNPYADSFRGTGTIRTGLAALDPRNGLPYTWNPTRQRGYGVFDFAVTPSGLLVGHDTKRVGQELHQRLAYFPLAGGTTLADEATGSLPGDLCLLGAAGDDSVVRRAFDGSSVTSLGAIVGAGQRWGTSRASWRIGDTVYTGWSDGRLTASAFDGHTFGSQTEVDLSRVTEFGVELSIMTGAFYDNASGRLYYTLASQPELYYRYFNPQSQTVSGQRFVAQRTASDIAWTEVGGMFLAGDALYLVDSETGNLSRSAWSAGRAVAGTRETMSGPDIDGNDWTSRGLVLVND